MIKQLTKAALAAELDPHLAQDLEANRRNGTTKKTIRQQRHFRAVTGEEAPDHAGDEIEQKIIRMFALGMSYAGTSREIEAL